MKAKVDPPNAPVIAEKMKAADAPDEPSKARAIQWVTVPGGLPPGLDVSDRAAMSDWIALGRFGG